MICGAGTSSLFEMYKDPSPVSIQPKRKMVSKRPPPTEPCLKKANYLSFYSTKDLYYERPDGTLEVVEYSSNDEMEENEKSQKKKFALGAEYQVK